MKKLAFGLLLALAVALAAEARAVAIPAISITGPNVASDAFQSNTFGYDFSADGNSTITALGVFDDNGDGLDVAYAVGVWDSGASLLDSVVIPAGTGATLVDGFRYADLTTGIALSNGASYRIGVLVPAGEELVNGVTGVTPTGITINAPNYFRNGATLLYPNTLSAGKQYYTANMLLVPAPPAAWLVGSGILAVLGVARRRHAAG